MNLAELNKLKDERKSLVKEARAILEKAKNERRDLKADEERKYESTHSRIESLGDEIDKTENHLRNQRDSNYRASVTPKNNSNKFNMDEKDLKQYSLQRAIRSAANGENSFEREVSRDIANRKGRDPSGVYVPHAAILNSITVTGDGDGASLVPLEHGQFIDALRPRHSVAKLGATILSILEGDVSLPRQVSASSVGWKGETAELDEASPEFDSLTLRPKRVGSFAVFSKQLLEQSDPSIGRIISNDLLAALAIALDKAAIQGTGKNNQPTGLLHDPEVQTHALDTNGGVIDYADLVELVRILADGDADSGSLAWLTNPSVRAALQKQAFAAGDTGTLWQQVTGNTGGLGRWEISTLVPKNLTKGTGEDLSALIYGDFSQLILASWGDSIDLLVDPFSRATTGETRVILNAFADVGIRRPEKFIRVTDIDTSGS